MLLGDSFYFITSFSLPLSFASAPSVGSVMGHFGLMKGVSSITSPLILFLIYGLHCRPSFSFSFLPVKQPSIPRCLADFFRSLGLHVVHHAPTNFMTQPPLWIKQAVQSALVGKLSVILFASYGYLRVKSHTN